MVRRNSSGDEYVNCGEDANKNLNCPYIKMSVVLPRNSSSREVSSDVVRNLKSLPVVSNLSDEDASNGEDAPET